MFQNIIDIEKEENEIDEAIFDENINNKNLKNTMQGLFTKQNILTYIIAFMLSMVSSINGMAPFGLAIFAATLSNAMPIGIVYIVTLIGTAIGFGMQGVLTYIFTSLVFVRNGTSF